MASIEITDHGDLQYAPIVVGEAGAHIELVADPATGYLMLRRADGELPFWKRATPAERAEAFRKWADEPRPSAPAIPDEALRRENLYD